MNIETWKCNTTHSACNCVLERLNRLEEELKAARECVEYLRTISGQVRGGYKLDGLPWSELECLVKYDEARRG